MLLTMQDGTLVLKPDVPLIALHEAEVGCDIAEAVIARDDDCVAVVLDLSLVREIDSRGVSVVVDLHRRCRQQGLAFCVAGVTDHVRRVLDLFQLATLFPIATDAAPTLGP